MQTKKKRLSLYPLTSKNIPRWWNDCWVVWVYWSKLLWEWGNLAEECRPSHCCCQGIQKRLILWVLCASQLGGVKIPAERWTHPWSPKTCPDPALPLRIVVSQLCNARPLPADITQLCVVYFEIHYLGNLSHISWKLCSILAEEKKDFPNGLAGVLVCVREYWRWTILFPTIISSSHFLFYKAVQSAFSVWLRSLYISTFLSLSL